MEIQWSSFFAGVLASLFVYGVARIVRRVRERRQDDAVIGRPVPPRPPKGPIP